MCTLCQKERTNRKRIQRPDKQTKQNRRTSARRIITQASAIAAALNSFNKVLLSNHIKTCVVDNIREGNDEVVDELITMLKKSMK